MSERDDARDTPRDAHLREALRHAPDAQLQAPPQLSALILNEARAKARDATPAPTATPGWARSVWGWLTRPAVATGFAGVMAATLVGLMWWDQPMDEAQPRSPVPAAAPVAQRPAASVPQAPAVERSQPAPELVTSSPKPEPARKKAAEAPRGAAPGTAAPARSDAAPAPVTLAPAPAPAPAPAAPPAGLSADAAGEAVAQARAKEEEHKRERSSMAPAEAQQRRAAAKAQLNESRLQLEGEAYTRVASVRAAIASESARWSWQRTGAAAQPMGEAVLAWLAQLDNSTGTQWQPHRTRETTAPRGRALALLRDGQLQHSFQLTERGVLWQRGQTAWQVELPTEQVDTLKNALDAAAP